MNMGWTEVQAGEALRDEGGEGGCYLFWGAGLRMAGSEDLQGFCSKKLVNISEALTVY